MQSLRICRSALRRLELIRRNRKKYAHFRNQVRPRFLEHKCVFIHVPKCAGCALSRAVFGLDEVGHFTSGTYRRLLGEKRFQKLFKFTFVRNPWDRVVSTYAFLAGGGMGVQDQRWVDGHPELFESFESFVELGIADADIRAGKVHLRPQHTFVCTEYPTLDVDFIGKYESLAEDFEQLSARISVQHPLRTCNASNRGSYRSYYSPKTIETVGEAYHDDITLFGYTF